MLLTDEIIDANSGVLPIKMTLMEWLADTNVEKRLYYFLPSDLEKVMRDTLPDAWGSKTANLYYVITGPLVVVNVVERYLIVHIIDHGASFIKILEELLGKVGKK